MKSSVKGACLATAVAGLFMAGACVKTTTTTTSGSGSADDDAMSTSTGAAEKVECWGVNECKGQGECGSAAAGTSCAGTNACKGKGWISLSKQDCLEKGGRLEE